MKKDKKSMSKRDSSLRGRRAASWSWSVDDYLRDEDTLENREVVEPAPEVHAAAMEDRAPVRTGARQKLCKLVKDEAFADNIASYMELVREAEYVCRKCGRSAGDKGNLCRPVPLEFKYE